jgi:2-methylisocitrate lyase-like PEP mutase family enzyme
VGDLATLATELRARHRMGDPLVLPNAWDAGSARVVAAAGFGAVATSSAAVARVHGLDDGDTMPPDVAFGAVAEVASASDVPVTADLEAGYGLDAAAFVERLLAAGAVGCNLEDTDHHGPDVLVDAGLQADRIAMTRTEHAVAALAAGDLDALWEGA